MFANQLSLTEVNIIGSFFAPLKSLSLWRVSLICQIGQKTL